MKAAQINKYGGNEAWEINQNAPKPSPSKEQILVEVSSSSINPIDLKIRAGFLKEMAPLQFPATLGGDFSGTILEIGEGVSDFKSGDTVYGQAIILNGGSGSFAQYLVANAVNLAHKPKKANFEEAGALPLAGSSAIQALVEHIKLQSGQKILIHGGAGGIGHIAIQLAKSLGAYVATTVSSPHINFVKNLGADEVIDYKNQNFEDILKNFDAVFDTVGGETLNKSFAVVKKRGIIVSMLGQPNQEFAEKYGITALGQGTNTNTLRLIQLAKLVDSGKIKVHVDKIFPLSKIREACDYQEKNHPRGKVVVKIN